MISVTDLRSAAPAPPDTNPTSASGMSEAAAAAAAPGSGAVAAQDEEAAPPQLLPRAYDPLFAGTWIKDRARSDPLDLAMDAMRVGGIKRRAIALVRGLELSFCDAAWDGPGRSSAAEPDDDESSEYLDGLDEEGGDGGPAAAGAPAEASGPVASAASAAEEGPELNHHQHHHQHHHHQHQPQPRGATQFTFAVFSVLPLLRVRERYPLDGPAVSLRRRDLRGGRATGRARALDGGGAIEIDMEWGPPHPGRGKDVLRLKEGDPDELIVTSLLTMEEPATKPVPCVTVYRRQR